MDPRRDPKTGVPIAWIHKAARDAQRTQGGSYMSHYIRARETMR